MEPVSDEVFESLIDDALDLIPDSFARHMTNVVVLARPHNPDNPSLLGLFEGVPLPAQHSNHTGYLRTSYSYIRTRLKPSAATLTSSGTK